MDRVSVGSRRRQSDFSHSGGRGARVRQITFHSAPTSVYDWFPDGKSLLVTSSRATQRSSLYRLDVMTGRLTLLLTDENNCALPALSPDGKWIALHARRAAGYDPQELPGRGQLRYLDRAGRWLRRPSPPHRQRQKRHVALLERGRQDPLLCQRTRRARDRLETALRRRQTHAGRDQPARRRALARYCPQRQRSRLRGATIASASPPRKADRQSRRPSSAAPMSAARTPPTPPTPAATSPNMNSLRTASAWPSWCAATSSW